MRQQLWAGVDAGKADHHCVVIDTDGQRLLSQRVANDETPLQELITSVTALAEGGEVTWAIDLNHGGAALLITLLITAEQRLLYIPGRTVYHASGGGYRGDGKTDAKDAAVIADQARMRRDLQPLRPGDDIAVDLAPSSPLAVATWSLIGPGRSTGCAPSCSSTSLRWSGRSTTATARPR